jgi:hypothetical protein
MILVIINGSSPFLVAILESSYGDQIVFGRLVVIDFQKGLQLYMSFKMKKLNHFLSPLFSFGFCVFGCPLATLNRCMEPWVS